jgi:hypothetical protein
MANEGKLNFHRLERHLWDAGRGQFSEDPNPFENLRRHKGD